jgi:hypothetical protein
MVHRRHQFDTPSDIWRSRPVNVVSLQRFPRGNVVAGEAGMTIDPLSNSKLNFLQPPAGTAAKNVSLTQLTLPQDSTPDISQVAQILSKLRQIQQQDPAQFQQMATTIAGKLQQAAENAKSQGNLAQVDQFNKLAGLFQNAANNGQVPSAQALQQAGLSAHHHHHGGHHSHSGGQTSQTDPFSLFQSQTTGTTNAQDLTTIFDSVMSGSGTGAPTR